LALRWPSFRWPRGLREAALAIAIALSVHLGLSLPQFSLVRGLETASLDLRFRLRGAKPAEPQTVVVLVDDRSLDVLGRPPLSRRVYAQAVEALDRAGAKLTVFDLLFAEPEQPIPAGLREAARTDAALGEALTRFTVDDPDSALAAAIKNSGKVLLPLAFSFKGQEQDEPPLLADHVYQRLDQSQEEPVFPLQPHGVLMPVPILAEAAAGLGHVNLAFDRDGAPRYDYVALPFSGDFVPSMPVRAVAAYRGVAWTDVGLALGD